MSPSTRRHSSLHVLLWGAAPLVALAATARPVLAQAAAGVDRPGVVAPMAASSPYTAVPRAAISRTVATYQLAVPRVAGFPSEVTVADSAGALVASFRLPGARAAHAMTVEVFTTDLVLQGETPAGVLTLQLFRQNDREVGSGVRGRWVLGTQEGALRGRATH